MISPPTDEHGAPKFCVVIHEYWWGVGKVIQLAAEKIYCLITEDGKVNNKSFA